MSNNLLPVNEQVYETLLRGSNMDDSSGWPDDNNIQLGSPYGLCLCLEIMSFQDDVDWYF